MPVRQRALIVAVLAAIHAGAGIMPVHAAEQSDALTVLIAQGTYWQNHRRGDLAEQAWQKVLRIDPKQPDALYGMGIVEVDRKQPTQAQEYLVQLRNVAPNDPRIDELARRLGENTPRASAVDDARRLAEKGQSQAAVQKYQEAIAKGPVTPELGLEYYQSLGATPQGYDEAVRGMTALAKAHPDDPRFALALAQQQTYREATRREGIQQLQKLASNADVGPAARTSWRQALLWLGGRASDEPLYEAYLQANPNDAAVKARYDALAAQETDARQRAAAGAAQSARGRAIAEGFDAAERNDLATAEARFQSVLKAAPGDGDALGGMGVVRLKQEKFADAKGYLERAMQGGNPGRWRDALKSATYWSDVSEALGARSNGETAQAKTLLEKAIAVDPSEVTAQNLLGDTLISSGDPRAAEAAYRMVLRRQADNPDAIRGLVGALAAQGRGQEAMQFADQLTSEQRARVGGISKLKAQAEQADARSAEARGDLGAARSLLEDALLNDPENPWMRLDLGRVYVKLGATGSARSLMDGLLAAHPDSPDVLYAAALLAAETKDWNNGMLLLQRVPVAQRTSDMTALQHRLWVHAQADTAAAFAARGQTAAARATLANAEPVAANDPELVATLASAYAQIGDTGRALTLIRAVLARSQHPDAGLLLQYAGVLLSTQQEVELVSVLQRLQSMPLSPEQREGLSSINMAVAIRRADALRVKGDLAEAFDAIAPALAVRPDDPELQSALGRMYASANEPGQALRCFQRSLEVRPNDLNTLMSAIGAGTANHDWSNANRLFQNALQIAPDNPRVLATGGRLYHAQGRDTLAAEYFRRSLIAENAPVGGMNGPLDLRLVGRGWDASLSGGTAPVLNPFVGRRGPDMSATTQNPAPSAGANGYSPSSMQAPAGAGYSTAPYPVQTMPYTPPPAPPAPYVAPSPGQNYSLGPRSSIEMPSPGYGPDANGASDSGGGEGSAGSNAGAPAGGYQAYPNQPAAYSQVPAGIASQVQATQAYPGQAQMMAPAPQGYPNGGAANAGQYGAAQAQAPQPWGAGQPNTQPNVQQAGQQPYPQLTGAQQGYAQPMVPVSSAPQIAPPPNAAQQAYAQQQAQGYVPAPGYPAMPQQQGGIPGYATGYAPGNGPTYAQPGYYVPQPAPWPVQAAPGYYPPNTAYAPLPRASSTPGKTGKSTKSKKSTQPAQPYPQYVQQGYPPPGYPAPGYPQPGYAPGYPQAGYAQPYPQQGYAPQAGYAPQPYAAQPYPQQAYAQPPAQAYTQPPAPGYAPQPYAQAPAPAYPQQAGYAQQAQPTYVPTTSSATAVLASALPDANAADRFQIGAPPPNKPVSVQDELDQINREQTSTMSAGLSFRNRDGTEGLSELTDIETPIEGRVRAGDGHIVVRATPVYLDGGTPDTSPATQSQFGTGLAVPKAGVVPGSQHANGVGLQVGYQTRSLTIDVGSTPLGFRETNITGDVSYRGAVNDLVSYQLSATRQPVTDSVLSYAGTIDPRSGLAWGGVMSSGARAQIGWDDGTNGAYFYGSYNYLDGYNVERNTRAEGGGGFYTHLINGFDESLTAGVSAMAMGYDKNLSGFTYGQGGYFSPQTYVALNLPVDYYGRSGNLAYRVNGSLGVQHFRENAEPYFPSNAGFQTAAANAAADLNAAANNTAVTATLPGQTKTGVRYNLLGVLEYQLAPQLFVGGAGGVDNASDFRQWYASFYMRYAFSRQSGSPLLPPSPLVSQYPQN